MKVTSIRILHILINLLIFYNYPMKNVHLLYTFYCKEAETQWVLLTCPKSQTWDYGRLQLKHIYDGY